MEKIKRALDLSKRVVDTGNTCKSIISEKFNREKPTPPLKKMAQLEQQPINSNLKFDWKIAFIPSIVAMLLLTFVWWGVLIFFLSIAWIPYYYFCIYKKKKEKQIGEIKNSLEYNKRCADAKRKFSELQEEYDASFQKEQKKYETEILPKYLEDLELWEKDHNIKVEKTKEDFQTAKNELDTFFEENKVVPVQYRTIDALQYIHDIMSSSDYNVKEAIEMYDRNEQLKIEEQKRLDQKQANEQALEQQKKEAVYNLIGNVISTTAGVAIGNKLSSGGSNGKNSGRINKGNNGEGRQNLFGGPMCKYGQRKDENDIFSVVHCDISCNLHNHCTQRGQYKVGS